MLFWSSAHVHACIGRQRHRPRIILTRRHHEILRNRHKDEFSGEAFARILEVDRIHGYTNIVIIVCHEFRVVHGRDQVRNAQPIGNAPRDNLTARLDFKVFAGVVKIRFAKERTSLFVNDAIISKIYARKERSLAVIRPHFKTETRPRRHDLVRTAELERMVRIHKAIQLKRKFVLRMGR